MASKEENGRTSCLSCEHMGLLGREYIRIEFAHALSCSGDFDFHRAYRFVCLTRDLLVPGFFRAAPIFGKIDPLDNGSICGGELLKEHAGSFACLSFRFSALIDICRV